MSEELEAYEEDVVEVLDEIKDLLSAAHSKKGRAKLDVI